MSNSDVEHLQELLAVHKRNLRQLEIQAARYGMDVPLATANQIRITEEKITNIEAQLARLGVSTDTPSQPSPNTPPPTAASTTATTATTPHQVFISYSHKDRKWLDRLQVHLKPLERMGAVARWDDTMLKPGQRWRDEIKKALEGAKVAVLLVSADFLASEFIVTNELPPLLKAEADKGTIILPVIVGHSRFQRTPELSQFQAVNPPSEPLDAVATYRAEEILVKLADAIEDALKN